MEHLLYGCEHYSAPLWAEFSAALTDVTKHFFGHNIPQVALTPREIIFNAMHPTLAHHITNAHAKSFLTLTIHELKRNILNKRMNIQQIEDNQMMPIIRIQAHLLTIQYQNTFYHDSNANNIYILFTVHLITSISYMSQICPTHTYKVPEV
jgi:hypothetical protein